MRNSILLHIFSLIFNGKTFSHFSSFFGCSYSGPNPKLRQYELEHVLKVFTLPLFPEQLFFYCFLCMNLLICFYFQQFYVDLYFFL